MNLLTHGFDLPTYPYDDVTFARGRELARVCTKQLEGGATSLVRGVDAYEQTPASSLLHLLTTVDQEHMRLAEIGRSTSAFDVLLDYQWGLTPLPEDDIIRNRHAHPLVPAGYALVAEVPLVPHGRTKLSYDQETVVIKQTMGYRQGKKPGDWALDNVNVYQFIPRATDDMAVYVDIDPYATIVQ